MTRPTFHLVPADVWAASDPAEPYRAEGFAREGFIHCTDGTEELIATANRHFAADRRPFVVLTIDLDRVGVPWRIEDARGVYPHVYGPIERRAVLGQSHMVRDTDGRFLSIGTRLGS